MRPEFVLLNLDCGAAFFEPHHPSARYQLQRTLVVQLRGPADG